MEVTDQPDAVSDFKTLLSGAQLDVLLPESGSNDLAAALREDSFNAIPQVPLRKTLYFGMSQVLQLRYSPLTDR